MTREAARANLIVPVCATGTVWLHTGISDNPTTRLLGARASRSKEDPPGLLAPATVASSVGGVGLLVSDGRDFVTQASSGLFHTTSRSSSATLGHWQRKKEKVSLQLELPQWHLPGDCLLGRETAEVISAAAPKRRSDNHT